MAHGSVSHRTCIERAGGRLMIANGVMSLARDRHRIQAGLGDDDGGHGELRSMERPRVRAGRAARRDVPRSNGLPSSCDGSGIGVFRRQMACIGLTSIHLTPAVGGIECPPHVVDEPVRARSPEQAARSGHGNAG